MTGAAAGELDVGGRRRAIRSLDRVLFPRAETTKAQVLDYCVRAKGRPTVSTPVT